MAHNELSPSDLVDFYGPDAPVKMGNGFEMTLGQALEAERILCPAEESARQDPGRRLGYLATMLAAGGSLAPEHAHLLSPEE